MNLSLKKRAQSVNKNQKLNGLKKPPAYTKTPCMISDFGDQMSMANQPALERDISRTRTRILNRRGTGVSSQIWQDGK